MAFTLYRDETFAFTAGDGRICRLTHVYCDREPSKGPVLLVHGAGVRSNIFRPPGMVNFVEFLLSAGYDVWLEDWRASIEFDPAEWTLDQAAAYDHPIAVEEVARRTGVKHLKAVVHCQGSTSFMMAAAAGLLPKISTIVSNAVSLHPIVPTFSRFKLNMAVPVCSLMSDYLNCQWGVSHKGLFPNLIHWLVRLSHWECDNEVCKQVSFTYGSGFPALWSHENLSPEVHAWLSTEFAWVPLAFFRQMARCVRAGGLRSAESLSELPQSFTDKEPKIDGRVAFFAGENNRCFLAESQRQSHRFFNQYRPGYDSLHVVPGYGHLDMFLGRNAARDVFPLMLAELDANAKVKGGSL